MNVDLNAFKRDHDFYGELPLCVTIKSFDLQAIRARYIQSKQANKSKKSGSVERRAKALGGVASMTIKQGQIIQEQVHVELLEPRGIGYSNGVLAITSENTVYVLSANGCLKIEHPWFSYLHSASIHGNKLLVVSSGWDSVYEFDLQSGALIQEWCAWDHGFNRSIDPETGEYTLLTKKASVAQQYAANGERYCLFTDPSVDSLPTAKRAAFINSGTYTNDGEAWVLTFFHEGAAFLVDPQKERIEKVVSGMKNPHGGTQVNQAFAATNTAGGQVILGDDTYEFANLPNKPDVLGDMEWLQNSIYLDGNIITIDSNRTSFVVFNPELQLYDLIPYNNNWAVQDLMCVELADYHIQGMQNLAN